MGPSSKLIILFDIAVWRVTDNRSGRESSIIPKSIRNNFDNRNVGLGFRPRKKAFLLSK